MQQASLIPSWVESRLNELSNCKVDKDYLESEISFLKSTIEDHKEILDKEFNRLFSKLDKIEKSIEGDFMSVEIGEALSKKLEKNSDAITSIYKWFISIMITLMISFVGTSAYFIKSASDISNQVSVNTENMKEVKGDLKSHLNKDKSDFKQIQDLLTKLVKDKP
jgi:hypothetical protein